MKHFFVQGYIILKEVGEEMGLYSFKNGFHFLFSLALLLNIAMPSLPTGVEGESWEAQFRMHLFECT